MGSTPLTGVNWAALVCPLLLPVSFLWDVVSYWALIIRRVPYNRGVVISAHLRRWWLSQGAASHEEKVRQVQEQVRARWVVLSASITSHRWSPQGWAQDVLGAPQLDEHLAAAPRLQGAAVAGEAGHAAGEATCYTCVTCCLCVTCCRTSCRWTETP